MDALAASPPLEDLYEFIAKVRGYPISIEKLLASARRLGATEEIISFYDSFMPPMTFRDRNELISCSEQVDVMRAERSAMPPEIDNSSEEY
jgi:hypothetical protein